MKTINDFYGLYPLSKTLRFSLKPQGKTLEHIIADGILEEDQHRAESYVSVKKIIDEYHKEFIDNKLSSFSLNYKDQGKLDSLTEYFTYYQISKKEESQTKAFESIKTNLRKQIADRLTKNEDYKSLFNKDLVEKDLITFALNHSEYKNQLDQIHEFDKFTTYFSGFHENRKNMYSAEEKSTTIAFRLINENLPKFIDNIKAFEIISQTEIAEHFSELYDEFKECLNVVTLQEMFRLDYYNMVLTQKQIEVYNSIIGGKNNAEKIKIKGLNEYINLYNQQHKNERLPKLKLLFKQILSDRDSISWLPEKFSSDEETLQSICACYEHLSEFVLGDRSLRNLLETIDQYDENGIFIRNDSQLTLISQGLTGNWSTITDALRQQMKTNLPIKRKESADEYKERIDRRIKSFKSFSLKYLNECLIQNGKPELRLEDYFSNLGRSDRENEQKENIFARISNAFEDAKDILTHPYPKGQNLCQDNIAIDKIKTLLDSIKDLQHCIQPLTGNEDEPEKDERFYGEFTTLWNELDQITPLYNKVRNYVTRKPYSKEKIKLNFQNATLLKGWDLNKERDNTSVILRKDGLYYLGIMNKKHNKIFDHYPETSENGYFEKMVYKQTGDIRQNIQNIILCPNGEYRRFTKNLDKIKKDNIPLIYRIKEQRTFTKENLKREDLDSFIDYYKNVARNYWNQFDFKFKETKDYNSWNEFTEHVEQQGYKITFNNISAEYIESLVEEGKLYLFQIYNKDFSPYSKGTPNMHTLYWKMLFDEQNLNDAVYKLNGEAEVFFRKSSIKYDHPTHPAGIPIRNKNLNNVKSESVFQYDLIKNRRYTLDSFQFHVPITINFKNKGLTNINSWTNEYLRDCPDPHIIGIDRGERHLLYLSVINMHGEIIEQFSLNKIANEYKEQKYTTDYHHLLAQKEAERLTARQSWQNIENIKELKEGYLSQVIHKIIELMIRYNAIIVLENLNSGFMRGRQKVEKQVYQKFEKMLIDKLNYIVDKKNLPTANGGLLKAYQLSNKFESFQRIGLQNGFLFYVPAWNTSKIDPVTGFVNLLDTRYESIEKCKSFFCKFDSIRYNSEKNWFEFAFNYNNLGQRSEGSRDQWTICTYGTRIETFRNSNKNNQWDSIECDLTERFKNLFETHHIDWSGNLKDVICEQNDKSFFETLLHLLKLTLQMRNSKTGTDIDYMISPIADENGNFYDSRSCGRKLPENADANGAYNIARKGLWIIRQIKNAVSPENTRLTISNKEWLRFAQEKPYKKN